MLICLPAESLMSHVPFLSFMSSASFSLSSRVFRLSLIPCPALASSFCRCCCHELMRVLVGLCLSSPFLFVSSFPSIDVSLCIFFSHTHPL